MSATRDSFKDDLKLLLSWVPKGILRPSIAFLWLCGLINRHYYIYSKLDFPNRVLHGPFKDMKYFPASIGSGIVPKYLGTYEKELWPALEQLCRSRCDTLVDVGSAEGYYAVGLTLRLAPKKTFCFDIDQRAHRLMRKIAVMNRVNDTIQTYLSCPHETLEIVLRDTDAPVVVVDCEGYEDELLNPLRVPSLRKARILVELHEDAKPGVTRRMEQRFRDSHSLERVRAAQRTLDDLPLGTGLDDRDARFAMDEFRPPAMEWMVMTPLQYTDSTPLSATGASNRSVAASP
jgi:hypothetical protein